MGTKKLLSVFGALLAMFAVACSSSPKGNDGGDSSSIGGDASVSTCCTVTPTNNKVPNPLLPGTQVLVAINPATDSIQFSGTMQGFSPLSSSIANRVIIWADTTPTDGNADFEFIVLDTGPTFDTGVAGDETDPDGNDGWSAAGVFQNGNEGAPPASNCAGGGLVGGGSVPAASTALQAAGASYIGTCVGARITPGGSGTRTWTSDGGIDLTGLGGAVAFRVEFFDEAGNLLNTNTSATQRGDPFDPTVPAAGSRLSDIFVSNDNTAPAVVVDDGAGLFPLPGNGVLTRGTLKQQVPLSSLSVLEGGSDLVIGAGAAALGANERNFRASNIESGDMVTVTEGANQGRTRFIAMRDFPLGAQAAVDGANASPSTAGITHVLRSPASGQSYELFHRNVNTAREREDDAGGACRTSPSLAARCADDADFDVFRGTAAVVQGRIQDADGNVNQLRVRAINSTSGLVNEVTAFLSRDINKATNAWVSTGEVLVVDQIAGTANHGATFEIVTGAGPAVSVAGATVTVDLGALPAATTAWVVDAVNIGTPNFATVVSNATDDILYTTVANPGPGAGQVCVQYLNAVADNTTETVTVGVGAGACAGNTVIQIELADVALVVTSTADDVARAINNDSAAKALVTAQVVGAGATLAAVLAETDLASGGFDTTTVLLGADPVPSALRATIIGGDDGTGAVGNFAATALSGATDTASVDPATPGRLVSNDGRIVVGLIDPATGQCLPPGLNVAATPSQHRDVCFAATLSVSEGRSTFTVAATDSSGNLSSGNAANQDAARDTIAAYFALDALDTPGAGVGAPNFGGAGCTADFLSVAAGGTAGATEPLCVRGASVATPGESYETFGTTVSIAGKVRDFIPGTTTFDTNATFNPAALPGALQVGDSGRVIVRVVTDTGFDSFSEAAGADALGNPIPFVDGDGGGAAQDMGEFDYSAVPLRIGGVTNASVTLWDQAGNITTKQFTVVQIAAATETPPSFAIDCIVDDLPKAGGLARPCAEDDDTPNPNSPMHLRAGTFGDPNDERGIVAVTTTTNNFNDGLSYQTATAGAVFGPLPYVPPIAQRVVASNRISIRGRTISRTGAFPEFFSINGTTGLAVPGDVAFGGNPNLLHGFEAVDYPIGFIATVAGGGANTNRIVIPLSGAEGTPADDAATETDEQLRVGDSIVLVATASSQTNNEGLYEIVALGDGAGGACDPVGGPECTELFLDRSLPQDATNMIVQAEWIWSARNVPVVDEGINALVFVLRDDLGNERNEAFSVLVDTQEPSVVIQGLVTGFETFAMTPQVFVTDSTLFFGGIDASGAACTAGPGGTLNGTCLTVPATYVSVSRNDANGFDIVSEPYEFGYALFADDIGTAPGGPADAVAVLFDSSDDDADTDPFSIPANDGAGGVADWPATPGGNVPTLAAGTVLGTSFASSFDGTPADALDGDPSCAALGSCPPGLPLSYTISVQAADRSGRTSSAAVSVDVVESAANRLLGGALGLISTNTQVINLISDNTDLSILTMDQIALSGVLFNMNSRLAELLGSPTDDATSNPRAFAFINNGNRDDFGILLGTVLQDPDGTGPGQSTAVTLANVVRILLDNGVMDDLLPIIDNTNIVDPRVGTGGPERGDFSLSNEFLRNLLIDQAGTSVACGNDPLNATAKTCYLTEGIIKEALPTVKATLDFGDVIGNNQAGFALRVKDVPGAPTPADLNSRLTGDGLTLNVTGDQVIDAGGISFLPLDSVAQGSSLLTNCATSGFPTPDEPITDALCRSVVNVQPRDIVVITSGICTGIARRATGYADSASTDTLPVDPFPTVSPDCVTACAGGCEYRIVHTNGPALNPVVELADLLTFQSYDVLQGDAGVDTRGGEREFLQGLLHVTEELFLNPNLPAVAIRNRSLICPPTRTVNGGDPTTDCAVANTSIDDAESLQAFLDLFSELTDDDDANNGVEFITRAIEAVNDLLSTQIASVNAPAPAGSTFAEALAPILANLLDDGTNPLGANPDGLLQEPPVLVSGGSGHRNTRLNLLQRSLWWMGEPLGTPVGVDLDADGTDDYTTDRPFIAILPLLRNLSNDPDDNPRGILALNDGAPPSFQEPGFLPSRSVAEKLFGSDGPVNLLLVDTQFATLLQNVSDILDPGTGVSDLTYFDETATITIGAVTDDANPFTVNPPLLRVVSELTAANLDINANGVLDAADEQPTEAMTRLLNVLLTAVGPNNPALEGQPDVDEDADGVPVDTPICNESFFRGRTPVEIVLNIVAQMLEQSEKDPKDFDLRDRTLTDLTGSGDNRTLLRTILDGLFDDPATNDQGGTLVSTDAANTIDDFAGNPCANTAYDDYNDNGDCDGSVPLGGGTGGDRGPNGGDRLAVPQSTVDILPELLNTMARFGFDDADPAEPLTSVFENCAGACPVNNGYPAATERLLSNARLGIDLALQLDAPFQVGAGGACGAGLLCFDQSLTRQFLESLSNLSNANAVSQILLLLDRMEENIQPINGTTSVPNPKDVSRSASSIRALADPDGDGDPNTDSILSDLIPLVQLIPASGQTQQILDLIRSIRGCGYDNGTSPARDVRGGELLREQENVFLAMLDAYSGATNVLSADGGTAECPVAAGRGATGGIMDSNPLFPGQSSSNKGVLVGGSQGESAVAGQLTDATKDFRALGAGPTADLCIRTATSPVFTESCSQINARPTALNPEIVAYTNNTPDDLNAFIAANCNGGGPTCAYRVRMMREPFNGCRGGDVVAGGRLGYSLSSFGQDGITPNAFNDARLDLLLRALGSLADGGNAFGGQTFLDRLEATLQTVIQETGSQSIAKNFLFGPAGPGSGEEGPLQALVNDDPTRSTLTSFLSLFSILTNSPVNPNPPGVQDARDTFPDTNWSAVGGANGCGVGVDCDGNAIHDAIDYQLLALGGPLAVLGNPVGLDGDDCALLTASPNPFSSNPLIEGHCDDPATLFLTLSLMIQNDRLNNLIPGLQIIAEATDALGEAPALVGTDPTAWASDPFRDQRTAQVRANQTLVDRDALADILQRVSQSAVGDDVVWDLVDNQALDGSFVGAYPEDMGPVLEPPGAAPTDGVLEGPQQLLVRGIFQAFLEYVEGGIGSRRGRFTAIEDLVARLSGARTGENRLKQALRILREITLDQDDCSGGPADCDEQPRSASGFPPGERDDTGLNGSSSRPIGPILSVQAGLANRDNIGPGDNQSPLDVLADFLNTLLEDPTDCDATTAGVIERGIAPVGAVPTEVTDATSCAAGSVEAVFRDVGVLVERPVQPIFDEAVFDSLSQLLPSSSGQSSTLVGALPFLASVIDDQLEFLDSDGGRFTEYDYYDVAPADADRAGDALLADLQTLIPGDATTVGGDPAQLARFDPLLTDDLNRNGLVGDLGLDGTGVSSPPNDLDADCSGVDAVDEVDNAPIDCVQPANVNDGNSANDWGQTPDACGARCDAPGRTTNIGFTAVDGVATLGNLSGLDAAFFDGLADVIANDDPARMVNNQSNRSSTSREEDVFTQRTVDAVNAVDPDFISLLTGLGDMLIETNQ